MSFFVEVHVRFRASYYNLCFVSVKSKLVPLGIVRYNSKSTLQSTGRASKHIGIVSNTYGGDADVAHHKAE